MRVECKHSKALPISAQDQHVKDRLALSTLCNNPADHPYDSYSSRATSHEENRLSQILSSSSNSSSRANPVSPSPFLKRMHAPDFTTSRRLPPISNLKLFNQHQRSAPETAVRENGHLFDDIQIPIHSGGPHQFAYHDIHPPATQSLPRKAFLTSSSEPFNVPSNVPPFSPSPSVFSRLSCTNGTPTYSPMPEVQSYVMTRRKWSPPTDAPLSPLSSSQGTSSYKHRIYHSQCTTRVCTNCGVMETRQWVRGENQTWLCHSCGQFWRKNGYSRPQALWNRPTLKRSSRKLKVTNQGVGDTKRIKGSARQTVSPSFLDGKKMIQLETCLSRLPCASVVQNVVQVSDSLKTR